MKTGWTMGFLAILAVAAPQAQAQSSPVDVRWSDGATFSGPHQDRFLPESAGYTISNGGMTGVSWQVSGVPSWLSVEPPLGYLAPGHTVTITLSVDGSARWYAAGVYSAAILFEANGAVVASRSITLHVGALAGPMIVSPDQEFESAGPVGGPFAPSRATYIVRNEGTAPIDWTAEAALNWLVVTPSSGTLAPGASVPVRALIRRTLVPQREAEFMNSIEFTNMTNGLGNTWRQVRLGVGGLGVASLDDMAASGLEGGPFTPATHTFTLTNYGAGPLDWSATSGQNWITVEPSAGTLAAGAGVAVTISINQNASTLVGAAYQGAVTFESSATGNTRRTLTLTVGTAPAVESQPATGGGGGGRCGSLGLDLLLPAALVCLLRRVRRG